MRKMLHNALCGLLSLSLAMLGAGCSGGGSSERPTPTAEAPVVEESDSIDDLNDDSLADWSADNYSGLNDPELLSYIKDASYQSIVQALDTDQYIVQDVKAVYVSQEYLEQLEYNSQANVYFGYSLSDLDMAFIGERYVFTVGKDGKTTVKAFEAYDDTFDKVMQDVAIGGGVILVCVTVSAVTGGLGLPAVSYVFAVGAEKAAASAAFSALSGGAVSAGFTALQGGSVEDTLKSAAIGAGDGFKWGAIFGSVDGIYGEAKAYRQAIAVFKDVELAGLTPQEAALIQCKSKYPMNVIKQFNSVEEFDVYFKKANLKPMVINNKTMLVQDIDPNFKVTIDGKTLTNRQLMEKGNAPYYLDKVTGKPKQYQLHHIGQKNDATLAILTEAQHTDYSDILHLLDESEIDRNAFKTIRKKVWKSFVENL